MRQDLFHIPHEWLGMPVFGAGWLLLVWAIASAVLLVTLWRRQGWNTDTSSYVPLLALMGLLIWLVLPRLEDMTDVGTSAGLPIRGYGVMLLLGVLGGVALAVREARRVGLDPVLVVRCAFICLSRASSARGCFTSSNTGRSSGSPLRSTPWARS